MKRIALIAVAACLMTGCHINLNGETKWNYEHPERYQTGDAVIDQTINEVDVDWLEGNIDIVYADQAEVHVYEVTDSVLSDSLRMHWYVDDEGCLKIQFCKNGTYKTRRLNNLGKHLTIAVPRGMALDELDVDAVSTELCIDSVVSRKLSLDGVSVNLNANYPTLPAEIDINGVNCEININMASDAGMTIEMSGVNSKLNNSLPSTKDGKKTVIGDGKSELDIDAVNCTLSINNL